MKKRDAKSGREDTGPSRTPLLAVIQPTVSQAVRELRAKTESLDGLMQFEESKWTIDQNQGTIEFERPDGIRLLAPVQIIGTYDTIGGTWLWAWDHPSVDESLQRDSKAVLAYGQTHAVAPLTTRKLRCGEQECWDFTALACKLCGRQGGYRGPAGGTLVFANFGEISIFDERARSQK